MTEKEAPPDAAKKAKINWDLAPKFGIDALKTIGHGIRTVAEGSVTVGLALGGATGISSLDVFGIALGGAKLEGAYLLGKVTVESFKKMRASGEIAAVSYREMMGKEPKKADEPAPPAA